MLLISACSKEEGEGGQATITGKVHATLYSTSGEIIISEYYVPEERVYITYGNDDDVYDDWVRTNYDGTYEFKYLNKGDYTIFAYSNCSQTDPDCPAGKIPVFEEVKINSKKGTILVPDIEIIQ